MNNGGIIVLFFSIPHIPVATRVMGAIISSSSLAGLNGDLAMIMITQAQLQCLLMLEIHSYIDLEMLSVQFELCKWEIRTALQ